MTDTTDNPVARLRAQHWQCDSSSACQAPRRKALAPCDVAAALDALEAETEWLRAGAAKALDAQRAEIDALQARLDAAAVLIRQVMKERHTTYRTVRGVGKSVCGSPLGASIDTCENCRPYREWLGGEGQ